MVPDLLPHEERPVVLWGQDDVMDVSLLLVMYGDESMNRMRPCRDMLVSLALDTPCFLSMVLET
jgi:hypothetical protein